MIRKAILMTVLALSLFGGSRFVASDPIPECLPCPFVR
jgi:hypothetical protein